MNAWERNGATYSDNKTSEKEVTSFILAINSRQSCLVATIMSKNFSSPPVACHMNRTLRFFDWEYVGRVTPSRVSGLISRSEYSAVRDIWAL